MFLQNSLYGRSSEETEHSGFKIEDYHAEKKTFWIKSKSDNKIVIVLNQV